MKTRNHFKNRAEKKTRKLAIKMKNMKKSHLVIAFSIVLLALACSQTKQKNKKELDVYGGYSKCEIIVYEYKFGVLDSTTKRNTQSFKYNEFGHWIERIREYGSDYRTYKYDNNGNIIEKIYHNDPEATITLEHWKYKYNEKNLEIESSYIESDGTISSVSKSIYNEKDSIIERIHYDATGAVDRKTTYKYDQNDNLIERLNYNSAGLITGKTEFIYKNDKRIVENVYNENNEIVNRYEYKYDSKGNRIEESFYDKGGSILRKNVNSFDDKGNIIEVMGYNRIDGNFYCDLSHYRKYTFKYDNNGNIIEYIEYPIKREVFIQKSPHIIIYCEGSSSSGGKFAYTYERSRDSEGNCIEKTVGCRITYKYDDYGNIVEEILYDELNEPQRKKFTYFQNN